MENLSGLHAITDRLLPDKYNYNEVRNAAHELYEFLLSITGTGDTIQGNNRDIILESGKAIGIRDAAMCITDFMRTRQFMLGICRAVKDILAQKKGKPVHILYAGTGPFAVLVLPLISRHTPAEVQLTLLEIQPASQNCLQQLITQLGMQPFVRRIEMADAAVWQLPPGEKSDILLSETMQPSLKKEPLAAICMNLLPQLPADTILIPEQVKISAAFADIGKLLQYKMGRTTLDKAVCPAGVVFTFNKEVVKEHFTAYRAAKGAYSFPPVIISPQKELVQQYPALFYLTEITVYNNMLLEPDESGLTLPVKVEEYKEHFPGAFVFHYQTGSGPHLHCEATNL